MYIQEYRRLLVYVQDILSLSIFTADRQKVYLKDSTYFCRF